METSTRQQLDESRERLLRLGRPGSLSGLMNLYEGNYERLQQLLADGDDTVECAVSHSETDQDVHLTVLARTPYTSTLHLTYRFGDERRADPDITVRLYHDAELAEVVRSTTRRVEFLDDIDPGAGGWIERQHARNLLLNKWLDFLLQHGHGFVLAGRPRDVTTLA